MTFHSNYYLGHNDDHSRLYTTSFFQPTKSLSKTGLKHLGNFFKCKFLAFKVKPKLVSNSFTFWKLSKKIISLVITLSTPNLLFTVCRFSIRWKTRGMQSFLLFFVEEHVLLLWLLFWVLCQQKVLDIQNVCVCVDRESNYFSISHFCDLHLEMKKDFESVKIVRFCKIHRQLCQSFG